MTHRLSRWGAFWSGLTARTESGTSVALFRILVATVVLYSMLSAASWDLVDVLWADQAHGGMQKIAETWQMSLLGGATPTAAWTLWAVCTGGAFLMLLGIGGRAASFVTLIAYLGLTRSNFVASGSYDPLTTNALWLVTLASATRTLSVTCWWRTGAWTSTAPVAAWPRYIMVFQLLLMYGMTAMHKLAPEWTPAGGYSALYYVLHSPTWTRFPGDWIESYYWVTQISTAVTWHWEQSAFLMMLVYYFRYTAASAGRLRSWLLRFDLRKPWALGGIGLHVGILALMNVGPFSWISLAYYVVLWTPEEIEGVFARLTRRRRTG